MATQAAGAVDSSTNAHNGTLAAPAVSNEELAPVVWAAGQGTSLKAPSFQAVCRLRPSVTSDVGVVDDLYRVDTDGTVHAFNPSRTVPMSDAWQAFAVTAVVRPTASQADIFQVVETAIGAITQDRGGNVTVLLHGPTGSGKSHTAIDASEEDAGLLIRAVEMLKQHPDSHLSLSCLEIDDDSVRDLLAGRGAPPRLDLHYDSTAGLTKARGAAEPKIPNVGTLRAVLESAERNQKGKTHTTQLRAQRAHIMYRLFVKTAKSTRVLQFVHLAAPRLQEEDDMSSVKLADQAKRKKELVAGNAEANKVNKGLTQLGTVLNAVQSNAVHVPYRSTKLTYALQGTLGGSNKCVVVGHVIPDAEFSAENLVTLQFTATVYANMKSKRNKQSSSGRPRAMSFDTSSIKPHLPSNSAEAPAEPRRKRAGSFHASSRQ
jgi:hypothetical protein